MIYIKAKQPNNKSGFTLVEVLVSLSLLLVVLVGPLTFLASSSQNAQISNEQIPATFLAQEGVELVHKVRDDELVKWFKSEFSGTPWQDAQNKLSDCLEGTGCGLEVEESNRSGDDVHDVSVHSCSEADSCVLYRKNDFSDSNGTDRKRYTYDSSGDVQETPYTRTIYLNPVGGSDREIEIVSEVRWRSGTLIQEQVVEVKTSIFNVYDTD